jgi:hypothetical protein
MPSTPVILRSPSNEEVPVAGSTVVLCSGGGGGGGSVQPGVSISPAYAGMLSTEASIAAVPIALRVFIGFSPVQFFGLVKAVNHTKMGANCKVL